jgi:flagellin-like hook-associated protein FlgL
VAFDGVQITMRDGSGPPAANDLVRVQTGIQYQGDGGVQTIEVGDQQTVKTNLPGSQVFSGPSLDLFTSLKSFSASLTGHYGAGLTQGIADIGAAKDQIGKAQGEVGALSNRLTTDQAALQDAKSLVQSSLSQEQDADVVQAISDLSMQQVAMQASAQAASQIFQTSLLNFLK